MENISEMGTTDAWFLSNTSAGREFNLTTQSFQSMKSDSSTDQSKQAFIPCNNPENLIDETTGKQVERLFQVTLLPLIVFFGITTNIINCIVFARQGLKDRINLCLFSLALADISFLLMIFTFKFFGFLGVFDEDLSEYWKNTRLGTVLGPRFGTMNISNLMTMIISVERCICVVSPFTAKKFLKTRHMAGVIVILAVYILGAYSLLNMKYSTRQIIDPTTNTSRWVVRLSDFYLDNQTVIDIVYHHLLLLTVPFLSLATVIVTTSITVIKLRQTLAWRHQSVNNKASVDRREMAVTKMLTVVCFIYVTAITPSMTQAFCRTLIPGYMASGKYCNMFFVMQTVTSVLEATNSSVNFIVYFTMGSRFRDTVRQLFGTGREKKESPAESLPSVSVSQEVGRHASHVM